MLVGAFNQEKALVGAFSVICVICGTSYDVVQVYREECRVEYDTACHQQYNHHLLFRGYKPTKIKRDLHKAHNHMVPVSQGAFLNNCVCFHVSAACQVATQFPAKNVAKYLTSPWFVSPALPVIRSLTSSAAQVKHYLLLTVLVLTQCF